LFMVNGLWVGLRPGAPALRQVRAYPQQSRAGDTDARCLSRSLSLSLSLARARSLSLSLSLSLALSRSLSLRFLVGLGRYGVCVRQVLSLGNVGVPHDHVCVRVRLLGSLCAHAPCSGWWVRAAGLRVAGCVDAVYHTEVVSHLGCTRCPGVCYLTQTHTPYTGLFGWSWRVSGVGLSCWAAGGRVRGTAHP